jgi:spermidine/putrescine transport system substrate-binding protein
MTANNHSRRSILGALSAVGAAGIGISLTGLAGCTAPKPTGKRINFYNWDTYIGETTLEDFKGKAGIDVNMSLFANNDELFAKMKAGNSGFDVIMPSNDFVTRLSQSGLIQALDHSKIPNIKNIDPSFMDPAFDPGRKFSLPYTWLTLGIGYRKSKMPAGFTPDSWKYVFESNQFKKRISWLGESGDLIRLCIKYLGGSLDNITPELLAKAEEVLTKQVKGGNILNFHSDDGQDILMRGDVDLVIEYNGDMAQKNSEDPDMAFIIPKEGSQLNSDCMAIPTDSKNVAEAHAFIDYLLDAEAGAKIADYIQYGTPNSAAKALMSDSYKNNPIIFPPAEILARCEYAPFPGAEMSQKFEEIISRVRAAGGMG